MTDNKLWLELLPIFLPDPGPYIEGSVKSLGALSGMEKWDHQIHQLLDAMRVVQWGLPLYLIGGDPSYEELKEKISTAILVKGEPSEDDFSEAQAAGLLTLLSSRVMYLNQPGNARKHDLMTYWQDGTKVEVEVTMAEEKYSQKALKAHAYSVANVLNTLNAPYDLIVYILDTLTDKELDDLLAKASTISPGTSFQVIGRWHLEAGVVPPRDPHYLDLKPEPDHQPPPWFPEQDATPFIVSGTVAGANDQTLIPARIYIYWGLSTSAYINPLEKKVARFQGSGTLPYIVAINVAHLPAAYQFYEKELPTWFTLWGDISGILAFEQVSDGVSYISLRWQFLPNPNAIRPVSCEVHESLKAGRRWEANFRLYKVNGESMMPRQLESTPSDIRKVSNKKIGPVEPVNI